jgi:hypothetical protein
MESPCGEPCRDIATARRAHEIADYASAGVRLIALIRTLLDVRLSSSKVKGVVGSGVASPKKAFSGSESFPCKRAAYRPKNQQGNIAGHVRCECLRPPCNQPNWPVATLRRLDAELAFCKSRVPGTNRSDVVYTSQI